MDELALIRNIHGVLILKLYFNPVILGDAAVTAHFMEFVVLKDLCIQGYTPSGDCKSLSDGLIPATVRAERLKWEFNSAIDEGISKSMEVAQKLIDEVEMSLLVWTEYGKGFIKHLRISPDAFIQMALQLTYFRVILFNFY